MRKYGLNKYDKLCSPTAIDRLFSRRADNMSENDIHSIMSYPLRAVWTNNTLRNSGNDIQFLISVPKKRLRHAVDRVKMRRRIREAYRLNIHEFNLPHTNKTDLAFIYIANDLKDYQTIEKSICRIFKKIEDETNCKESGCCTD